MSDLNPITRREVFLAAAGGQQVETPEPITREENFLKAIAENAGGGSDLPDDPAQDGTYNLQNTVSSGTGTLSWASGSSGGVLVVQFTYDPDPETGNVVGDKTCKEVWDAYIAGSCVLFNIFTGNDYAKPVHGKSENGTYSFLIYDPNSGSYVEAMGEANENIYAYLGD